MLTPERHECSLAVSRQVNIVSRPRQEVLRWTTSHSTTFQTSSRSPKPLEFMRVSSGVAYGMARRYRSDQRPRGPPGLHGRRADDAGRQARPRPVHGGRHVAWRRRRLADRPPSLTLGPAAFRIRRSVGPIAWAVLECVAAGAVESRGGHRVPSVRTRRRRSSRPRQGHGRSGAPPARVRGARRARGDSTLATAASAPSHYRLTLPADVSFPDLGVAPVASGTHDVGPPARIQPSPPALPHRPRRDLSPFRAPFADDA